MTAGDVASYRLISQHIGRPVHRDPAQVVAALGAVQAQDYAGALWALGLRTWDGVEADVQAAIARRAIVRTWPMRGTLHFGPAADVRWMLALLTPRVIARSAARHRQLELDAPTLARSRKLVSAALQGGLQLTRPELYAVLERGGVSAAGQRGIHVLGHLAQEALICHGPHRGAVLAPQHAERLRPHANGLLSPIVVRDGAVVGTWSRAFKKGTLWVTPKPFGRPRRTETRALVAAAERYGRYLKVPVVVSGLEKG